MNYLILEFFETSAVLAAARKIPLMKTVSSPPGPLSPSTSDVSMPPHSHPDLPGAAPAGPNIPVTMQQVADRARVCRSTVSLALRNDPRVPAETRKRIQIAAEELGYRTNPLVATLMVQLRCHTRKPRSATLGFLNFSHSQRESSYRALLDSARQRADQLGFHFDEISCAPSLSPARLNKILTTRGIEGIILSPASDSLEVKLDWDNFAVAAIGHSLQTPPVYRVTSHYQNLLQIAVRRAAAIGYKRLGLCIPRFIHKQDAGGIVGGFCAHQHDFPLEQRLPILLHEEGDVEAIRLWIETQRPDVILCAGPRPDWLRRVLMASGRHVPDDIGLIHLDWQPDMPDMAGVTHPWDLIGAASVDLVVSLLQRNERGISSHPQTTLVDGGEWRMGPSVAVQGTRLPFSKDQGERNRWRFNAGRQPAGKVDLMEQFCCVDQGRIPD